MSACWFACLGLLIVTANGASGSCDIVVKLKDCYTDQDKMDAVARVLATIYRNVNTSVICNCANGTCKCENISASEPPSVTSQPTTTGITTPTTTGTTTSTTTGTTTSTTNGTTTPTTSGTTTSTTSGTTTSTTTGTTTSTTNGTTTPTTSGTTTSTTSGTTTSTTNGTTTPTTNGTSTPTTPISTPTQTTDTPKENTAGDITLSEEEATKSIATVSGHATEPEESGGGYMSLIVVFLLLCAVCLAGYLIYHHRAKVVLWIPVLKDLGNGSRSSRKYKPLPQSVQETVLHMD